MFKAFALVSANSATIYLASSRLSHPARNSLEKANVEIREYDEIYCDLQGLDQASYKCYEVSRQRVLFVCVRERILADSSHPHR